jgi:primosomal protein N'
LRIPLILGSATPTLESWLRAHRRLDTLVSMPSRVADRPMPPVHIIDTREDPRIKRGFSIGRALHTAIGKALNDKGQVILFLNLRGYSPGGVVSFVWSRHQVSFLRHFADVASRCGQGCVSQLRISN